MSKYKEKQMDRLKSSNKSAGYSILKKIGARLGEHFENKFELPKHIDMTPKEIANDMAKYFSEISQEHDAFDLNQLNEDIRRKISMIEDNDIPQLTEVQVYNKILAAKKNSIIPNDIPKTLIQEFSVELTVPATIIFNNAIRKLEFPKNWKKEYGTPIPKVDSPEENDDIRLISLSRFLSKTLEAFLVEWILKNC